MNVLSRLETWPRTPVIALSGVSILLVGVLDFITGYQLNLSALFLVPIFLLSWLGGRWAGLAGALTATAARTLVDVLGGRTYATAFYPAWNTVMRLIMFCFIALLISTIRVFVDSQRALARIDHLTGAANKRAFEEVVTAEIDRSRRYGRPFTLAYFDLDNFKSINDRFGHDTGDRLLRRVVDIMRGHVRASDVIGRLGGDEFALLLPEADEPAARSAISKIQSEFCSEMEKNDWAVTVSIGSLTCVADGLDVSQLLIQADRLMYAAKVKGKNSAQFAGPGPERS